MRQMQSNPVIQAGVLYALSPKQRAFALDAANVRREGADSLVMSWSSFETQQRNDRFVLFAVTLLSDSGEPPSVCGGACQGT